MDLIARTKEAVKEFDNLRYRRMKKVFLDREDGSSLHTSQSSVPNSSLTESNDLILMDMDSSNNLSYPILDDDDSRSTDFISDTHPTYADDDESFNSSQSSLPRHLVRLSNVEPSCLQPLQIDVNEEQIPIRTDVRHNKDRSSHSLHFSPLRLIILQSMLHLHRYLSMNLPQSKLLESSFVNNVNTNSKINNANSFVVINNSDDNIRNN